MKTFRNCGCNGPSSSNNAGNIRRLWMRFAMLNFFPCPALCLGAKLAVSREDVAEIGGVVAAVVFNEAGGLDDLQGIRVDLARVEAVPWQIVQRPVLG